MGDLSLLLLYVAIGVGGYKLYKYVKLKKSQLNLVRFDQEVDDLVFKRDKAMTLHRMLTDVDICDKKDDNFKVFEIRWKSEVDGEIYSYDLYVSDKKSANATALKTLIDIEMNNLSPEIKTGIEKLKLRSKMLGGEYMETVQGIAHDEKNPNHYTL